MLAKGSNGEDFTQTECKDCATTARDSSFDELTKGFASGTVSRGRALKMLGAALVGAVLASGRGAALADNECKPLLKKCNHNAQCCSGTCLEGRCEDVACPSGEEPCAGSVVCCSNSECLCLRTAEGGKACFTECRLCGPFHPAIHACTSSSDCSTGYACAATCGCRSRCAPLCGTPCPFPR